MKDLVEEFWDLELIESLYAKGSLTSPNDFRDRLHQLLGRNGRLLLTGSARQALRIVLARAARGARKRRVLLSSFNCRVVKESVREAGLVAETFDLATPNGRVDWEMVGGDLTPEHLAVVVPHFFGIPTDFTELLPAARRNGVMIIEDCAHALGASIGGTPAGLLGDAAVFSFNYDKPVSLAGGGALMLNQADLDIDPTMIEAPPSPRLELRQFRQVAATLLRGRERRVRGSLLARIGGRLRIPAYALPQPPSGIGPLRAAVGIWQLERYEEVRRRRDRNAQILHESLAGLAWHIGATVRPAHLKLRVTVSHPDAAIAVRQCTQHHIRIANSNWPKLVEPGGIESPRINAQRAATYGLDVPVHQNLSATDLHNIASAFAHAKAPSWKMPP